MIYLVLLIFTVSSTIFYERISLSDVSAYAADTADSSIVQNPGITASDHSVSVISDSIISDSLPERSNVADGIASDAGAGSDTNIASDTSASLGTDISSNANTDSDINADIAMNNDPSVQNSNTDNAAPASAPSPIVSISMSPATFDFGNLSPDLPVVFTGAAVLTIICTETAWNLFVTGADFSDGTNTIPASRMRLKLSTDRTYTNLSTSPVTLISNNKKTNKKGVTIIIDYEITLVVSDPAGLNYSNNITYTITKV